MLPDLAVVGEEEEVLGRSELLALVELAANAAPQVEVLGVALDEEGLLEAAVFLDRLGQPLFLGFACSRPTRSDAGVHPSFSEPATRRISSQSLRMSF